LVRYVERNAKRGTLVKRPEDWPWSSGYARLYGNALQKKLLSPWLVRERPNCLQWLNASQPKEEIGNIRYAIQRSRAYGSKGWVSRAVARFELENTLRSRGRPGKGTCHLFLPEEPQSRKGGDSDALPAGEQFQTEIDQPDSLRSLSETSHLPMNGR
jgi:hypothetical protein